MFRNQRDRLAALEVVLVGGEEDLEAEAEEVLQEGEEDSAAGAEAVVDLELVVDEAVVSRPAVVHGEALAVVDSVDGATSSFFFRRLGAYVRLGVFTWRHSWTNHRGSLWSMYFSRTV